MGNDTEIIDTGQGQEGLEEERARLWKAIEAAEERGEITYLTHQGKRFAAVVPVEVAEVAEEAARDQLQEAAAGAHEGSWVEAPDCPYLGHAQHTLNAVIERPDSGQPHAHWCGDLQAGHRAFMEISARVRSKALSAATG